MRWSVSCGCGSGSAGCAPVYTGWTICLTVVASAIAFAVATGVASLAAEARSSPRSQVASAWVEVVLETVVGLPLSFGLLALFRVPELKPAVDKIIRLVWRTVTHESAMTLTYPRPRE